jgi:hypothetical protein
MTPDVLAAFLVENLLMRITRAICAAARKRAMLCRRFSSRRPKLGLPLPSSRRKGRAPVSAPPLLIWRVTMRQRPHRPPDRAYPKKAVCVPVLGLLAPNEIMITVGVARRRRKGDRKSAAPYWRAAPRAICASTSGAVASVRSSQPRNHRGKL